MRRALGVSVMLGLLVPVGCSSDDGEEARTDEFCAAMEDHIRGEALLSGLDNVHNDGLGDGSAFEATRIGLTVSSDRLVAAQDPRQLMESFAAVDPPNAVVDAWDAWLEQLESRVAAQLVDADLSAPTQRDEEGRGSVRAPWKEVGDFWAKQCAEEDFVESESGEEHPLAEAIERTRGDPEVSPLDEQPDGGEVEVVDQGFTTWTHVFGSSTSEELFSYGVVVENTSDHVAVNTTVEVRAVETTDTGGLPGPGEFRIPILLPGQQFGVGATGGDPPELPDLAVEVDQGEWWPMDHDLVEFPEVSVDEVQVMRMSGQGDSGISLEVALDSDYPSPFGEQYRYAVFRNSEGEIVGGNWYDHGATVWPGRSWEELPQAHALPFPTDTDENLIEVYL